MATKIYGNNHQDHMLKQCCFEGNPPRNFTKTPKMEIFGI